MSTAASSSTTLARPVNVTVFLWWDIDSVHGSVQDVRDFPDNWRKGVQQRFNLGDLTRYRTTVVHHHSLHNYPEMHDALPDDIDVLDSGGQTVTAVIARKCRELTEDWRPNEILLWVVSCDALVIEHIRNVRQKGFNVFLVSDFEHLPKSITTLHWLEIYSYYVVAHGDLRKLMGHRIPRQIQDRTLGFASPIVLHNLQLRQPVSSPAPSPPPRLSRAVTRPPPLTLPPDDEGEITDDAPPTPLWNEVTRQNDPVYCPV